MIYNVRLISLSWTLLYQSQINYKKSDFTVTNTDSVGLLVLILYQVNLLHILCQTPNYKSQTLLLWVRPTFVEYRPFSF